MIDDSNPLLVTSGNPDLRTSTSHRINARLRSTSREDGRVVMGYANSTATRDYVGTASLVAERDTLLAQGVSLAPGGQYAYPVNMDGFWSARSFLTYGRPILFLRSNINATAGRSLSSTPRQINDVAGRTDAIQIDGRLYLGRNVSDRLDFSLSYGVNHTTVSNTSAPSQDDAYFCHRAVFQLNWLPWRGLSLSSDLNLSHYTRLSDVVDPTTVLWNLGAGYKFLRNDLAEVRLTVTDLLGRNTNVDRSVTGHYIEDSESRALGRYVMLNLVYKLRHFGI